MKINCKIVKFVVVFVLTLSVSPVIACGSNMLNNMGNGQIEQPSAVRNGQGDSLSHFAENEEEFNLDCEEELPPITVVGYYNPGPLYFWMGSGIWWAYTHPGSGGGVPSNSVSDMKLKFCFTEGVFEAIKDYWPVLSTLSTVDSFLAVLEGANKMFVEAGLRDIKTYVSTRGMEHAAPAHGSQHFINWNQLNIRWENYGADIISGSGSANITEDEALPIFKKFMERNPDFDGVKDDPQPEVDCD